jgi:hypothetical protein
MNKKAGNQTVSFDELFGNEGKSCERKDELLRYFETLLPDEDAEKFEKHLSVCSQCARELVELQETETAATKIVLDSANVEQIFDRNRATMQSSLDRKYGKTNKELPADSPAALDRFFNLFSFPAYANALVILLLAILIYPSYKGFILDKETEKLRSELRIERARNSSQPAEIGQMKQEYEKQIQTLEKQRGNLLQPTLSSAGVYAVREERAAQTQTINLEFSQRQRSFNILFSVPVDGYKSYRIEILDDGQSVWKDELTPQAGANPTSALISVNLRAEYFQKNSYRLEISGIGKEGPKLLAAYKLKVTQTHQN